MIDIVGIVNAVAGALHKVIQNSYEPIFYAVRTTLYHNASYTIILLVVILWLLKLLKNGYPTREEMFEAGKWIALICIIYAIFYSYAGYVEFIRLLSLPANWLRNATGDLVAGDNIVELASEAFEKIRELNGRLWNALMGKNIKYKVMGIPFNVVPSTLGILPFFIFYVTFAILIIGVILIVQASTYIALIILSVAPVMIPLLFLKVLRPYFFSWLKLYISYSLYAPLALIVLGIALSTIQRALEMNAIALSQIATGFWSILGHFAPDIILSILCIYLLMQIPNWVSQVMGVQGLQGGGVGAGAAIAAGVGAGVASGGAGTLAGGAIRYAQTGSVGKGVLGALKGGLGGLAKATPGAETAKTAGRLGSAVGKRAMREIRGIRTKDATASVY